MRDRWANACTPRRSANTICRSAKIREHPRKQGVKTCGRSRAQHTDLAILRVKICAPHDPEPRECAGGAWRWMHEEADGGHCSGGGTEDGVLRGVGPALLRLLGLPWRMGPWRQSLRQTFVSSLRLSAASGSSAAIPCTSGASRRCVVTAIQGDARSAGGSTTISLLSR